VLADPPQLVALEPVATETGRRDRGAVLAHTFLLIDAAMSLTLGALAALAFGNGDQAILFGLAAAALWPSIAFMVGVYALNDLRSWASGLAKFPRVLLATLLLSWPLYGVAVALGMSEPAPAAGAALLAISLLSALGHAIARASLHRVNSLTERTVIIGSGLVASRLVEKLRLNRQFGLEAIGVVDEEVHEAERFDLPRLGGFADFERILTQHDIDRVIIAFSRASHEQLLDCVRACRDRGVAVDVIPRLFELLDRVKPLGQVGGLPMLSIGTPRLTRPARFAKRALDVTVSGLALTVTAPLFAAIAAAIKLESPGPVFFRQPRAGKGGEVFQVVKFRSMYADADQRKNEVDTHNDLSDGVMFKIHQDPRVTRVGRFLRRWSLDELPQMINVFKGEMSLVGPRPLILPESGALEQKWHLRRLELRPGMTGPWQIYGRSDAPFHEMVRFDYQYVAGWSLASDVEILFATLPAVLSGRGAY